MQRSKDQDIASRLFAAAVAQHRQGALARAESLYRAVLELLGDHPKVLANLALALKDQGRLDAAETACRRGLARDERDSGLMLNLAAVLEAGGRFDEAAEWLEACLQAHPQEARAWNNLGKIQSLRGRMHEAVACLEKALELAPGYVQALNNLGVVASSLGQWDLAGRCFRQALEHAPADPRVLYNLAGLHAARGARREALDCLERLLRLEPEHEAARHLAAALRGARTDRAPAAYVEELFDRYAGHFDEHLTKRLGYTVPQDLAALAAPWRPARAAPLEQGLDIGCGTGQAGAVFRSWCRRLTGVDLSANMLARARERGCYDQLRRADILEYLAQPVGPYDLVVAADVLIYLGDLRPLLEALSGRMRPGGLLLGSVEDLGRTAGREPPAYRLKRSGRYGHHWPALEAMAGRYGFEPLTSRNQGIRREEGRWITGTLFVWRRRSPTQ